MTVPTLQLSDMAGHNNQVHFYQGVFSCTNTVPLYRLPFQNDTTNVMTLACEKCVHNCTHTSIQGHKSQDPGYPGEYGGTYHLWVLSMGPASCHPSGN